MRFLVSFKVSFCGIAKYLQAFCCAVLTDLGNVFKARRERKLKLACYNLLYHLSIHNTNLLSFLPFLSTALTSLSLGTYLLTLPQFDLMTGTTLKEKKIFLCLHLKSLMTRTAATFSETAQNSAVFDCKDKYSTPHVQTGNLKRKDLSSGITATTVIFLHITTEVRGEIADSRISCDVFFWTALPHFFHNH